MKNNWIAEDMIETERILNKIYNPKLVTTSTATQVTVCNPQL